MGHRTTRDLDLFWQGHDTLGDLAAKVTGALGATGFTVRGLRRTPAFARLHVESSDGTVEVDLVDVEALTGAGPGSGPSASSSSSARERGRGERR